MVRAHQGPLIAHVAQLVRADVLYTSGHRFNSCREYQIFITMYCIIKLMKNINGIELPVVLLDTNEEVWEFDNVDEALKVAEILTKNSDSGYRYYIKKV